MWHYIHKSLKPAPSQAFFNWVLGGVWTTLLSIHYCNQVEQKPCKNKENHHSLSSQVCQLQPENPQVTDSLSCQSHCLYISKMESCHTLKTKYLRFWKHRSSTEISHFERLSCFLQWSLSEQYAVCLQGQATREKDKTKYCITVLKWA